MVEYTVIRIVPSNVFEPSAKLSYEGRCKMFFFIYIIRHPGMEEPLTKM